MNTLILNSPEYYVMNIKIITLTTLSFILILSGYQTFHSLSSTSLMSDISDSSSLSLEEINKNSSEKNAVNNTGMKQWPTEIQGIINTLSEQYSDQIHLIHIQAKLIIIRAPIMNNLPIPSNDNLTAVLSSAFPNYENSILDVWARMDDYENWLLVQNRTLMELNGLSRNSLLWQKRNELFPKTASDIWSEEQDNYEAAQFNLHSEIDILDSSDDVSISEKIQRLESSFQQANGVFSSSFNQQRNINKNTIASVLFGLASVQKELQQLDHEHRQLEINSVRRELGYDEKSILKMSEIDEKRQRRWSNGHAYMKSRDQLLANNENLPEDQLDELRSQFFGNSASTIAKEEANGFYRFQRPRYYGRN